MWGDGRKGGENIHFVSGNLKTDKERNFKRNPPVLYHSLSKEALAKADGRKSSGLGVPKMMTENHMPTSDSREAFLGIGKLFHKEPCMSNSFH